MSDKVMSGSKPSNRIAAGLIGLVFIMSLACGATIPFVAVPTGTSLPASTATAIPSATAAATATASSVDILAGACRTEGMLTLFGTPPEWANYSEIFDLFEARSGAKVNSVNENTGSADELKAINDTQGKPGSDAPDVVDVRYSYGERGKAARDFQAYKVSTWDRIPDTIMGVPAKDPDGFWTGGYYGVMTLEVNTEVVKTIPGNWSDLLKPIYKGQVALAGDPHTYYQAFGAVFAASLANGGSLDNVRPGLDFFKKLNKAGNFLPVIALQRSVEKGTTPIVFDWDYNSLYDRDAFDGNPPIEVVYPSPTLATMYVQAISVHAPHPNCARLWLELLHSDAGQLAWMRGYVHGVSQADMKARGVIPTRLSSRLPSPIEYAAAVLPTPAQISAAEMMVVDDWDKVVGVKIRNGDSGIEN